MTTSKRRKGRPLLNREEKGYDNDLGHLDRLRKAIYGDPRVSPEDYSKVHDAIETIELVIRRFNIRESI